MRRKRSRSFSTGMSKGGRRGAGLSNARSVGSIGSIAYAHARIGDPKSMKPRLRPAASRCCPFETPSILSRLFRAERSKRQAASFWSNSPAAPGPTWVSAPIERQPRAVACPRLGPPEDCRGGAEAGRVDRGAMAADRSGESVQKPLVSLPTPLLQTQVHQDLIQQCVVDPQFV